RDLPGAERAPRGAADPRPRRGGDRVRAPPARRGARQRQSGAARLARARGGSLARRPHPRHLRGSDRPGVFARRDRGGARHRDDGRPARGGDRLTDAPHAPQKPADAVPSVAARLAFYQRASGIVTPILTAAVAFVIGGLVVLDRKSTRLNSSHQITSY